MKRVLSLAAASLIAGTFAFSTVSFAQPASPPPPQVTIVSGGAPTSDLPMAEYQAFGQFQSDHPEIVRQLSRNPRLLRSHSFQAKNPALRELFNNHPGLQTAMEQNPGDFLPLAPGATGRHHIWHHHHHNMMQHKATAHSESSSSAKTSGGTAPSGNATAAPSGNPPAGVNAAPSNGGSSGASNGGSSNPSGNM